MFYPLSIKGWLYEVCLFNINNDNTWNFEDKCEDKGKWEAQLPLTMPPLDNTNQLYTDIL